MQVHPQQPVPPRLGNQGSAPRGPPPPASAFPPQQPRPGFAQQALPGFPSAPQQPRPGFTPQAQQGFPNIPPRAAAPSQQAFMNGPPPVGYAPGFAPPPVAPNHGLPPLLGPQPQQASTGVVSRAPQQNPGASSEPPRPPGGQAPLPAGQAPPGGNPKMGRRNSLKKARGEAQVFRTGFSYEG